jgi:predicted esterase
MLDAKNMWMAMAAFGVVFLGWKALAPPPPPPDTTPYAIQQVGYGDQMNVVKLTRAECAGMPNRIWVVHDNGYDCLTVIVPEVLKKETRSGDTAILFIDGDVPVDQRTATDDERTLRSYTNMTESLSQKFGVPVVVVSRPGVLGSSGAHELGGRRDDSTVVNAALDEIKKKYGINRLIMAGQSGGSRLIAQLLVLGRRDIQCAVLGSGAYSDDYIGNPGKTYLVPMRQAAEIPGVRDRRIFVVGDPKDVTTPFPLQKAWADKLTSLNHHAVLVETEGRGEKHHGAMQQSLAAAGLCATGKPDADIIAAAKRAPQ